MEIGEISQRSINSCKISGLYQSKKKNSLGSADTCMDRTELGSQSNEQIGLEKQTLLTIVNRVVIYSPTAITNSYLQLKHEKNIAVVPL